MKLPTSQLLILELALHYSDGSLLHVRGYSVLPLKYASRLSAEFFLTKIRGSYVIVWTCHSCRKCMNFFMLDIQCHFVNVSMKHLKWSSQFIIHLSSFRLNIITKQLVIDVEDSALYNFKAFEVGSTFRFINVLIGWILSSISGSSSICIISITSSTFSNPTT